MPITRSAKKALRSSMRKQVFNRIRKDNVSNAVKSVKRFVAQANKKEAVLAFRTAQKALDKAVKGKTLSKNLASRKKSRLSKMIKKLG